MCVYLCFFYYVGCLTSSSIYSSCFFLAIKIQVCSNYMRYQDEVNQVIIHELIHAYDECRAANLEWSNCAHHACSEVRALKSRLYTDSCTF